MPTRCPWVPPDDELYVPYHDHEWGAPTHEDRMLFELLTLEGAQAGLSWRTVLGKRDRYRQVFAGFDPQVVAGYDESDLRTFLSDEGLIRNRLKLSSTISNAQSFLETQKEFGTFDAYLWGWVDGEPIVGGWPSLSEIPATTSLGDEISRDLKRRGYRFIGPTITYAYLQAVGVANDHVVSCFRFAELTDR